MFSRRPTVFQHLTRLLPSSSVVSIAYHSGSRWLPRERLERFVGVFTWNHSRTTDSIARAQPWERSTLHVYNFIHKKSFIAYRSSNKRAIITNCLHSTEWRLIARNAFREGASMREAGKMIHRNKCCYWMAEFSYRRMAWSHWKDNRRGLFHRHESL